MKILCLYFCFSLLYLFKFSEQSISQCKENLKSPKFIDYISSTEKYVENINNGKLEKLFMTVQSPANDTSSRRPLLIFAHGLSGIRSQFENIFNTFASRGFVAATIYFRGTNTLVTPSNK